MISIKQFRLFVIVSISIFLQPTPTYGKADTSKAHLNIALRMIGNEILLQTGDDSSRVMPVEKVGKRYKLSFENSFALNPLNMANAIHPIVKKTNIAEKYRVEVELCNSKIVVYGYEISNADSTDLIACARRLQPLDCYDIYFTILNSNHLYNSSFPFFKKNINAKAANSISGAIWTVSLGVLIVSILFIFFRKRNSKSLSQEFVVDIGKFRFNKRNMMLSSSFSKVELTGKEADLLLLLHSQANSTIEREKILKNVWGDEGDYVGRTLDVFISKLRKKLQDDSSLKIINIRGVGYKLLVNK